MKSTASTSDWERRVGKGTYNDVELAELLVDAADEDVDGRNNINENVSGNVFVGLRADC